MRDFQEIIAGILRGAQVRQGMTKTRLNNEMQLSFTQIKEYLYYLQQYKLVRYDEEKRVFGTTLEGKRFLKLYDEMTGLTSGRRDKFKK